MLALSALLTLRPIIAPGASHMASIFGRRPSSCSRKTGPPVYAAPTLGFGRTPSVGFTAQSYLLVERSLDRVKKALAPPSFDRATGGDRMPGYLQMRARGVSSRFVVHPPFDRGDHWRPLRGVRVVYGLRRDDFWPPHDAWSDGA